MERVVARVVVVELLFRHWRKHAGCGGVAAVSASAAAADGFAADGAVVNDAASAKVELKIGVHRGRK